MGEMKEACLSNVIYRTYSNAGKKEVQETYHIPKEMPLIVDSILPFTTEPLQGDSIHRWYRTIMGFDWKLVQYVIDILRIRPDHTVLDPFCGAGTTLVQCKKNGIPSVGIDANPVCTLATQVKTQWSMHPQRLMKLLELIIVQADRIFENKLIENDPALLYLKNCGMIDRGWLSFYKAKKLVSLRAAIKALNMKREEHEFFMLCLISASVYRIADIKFGPEVYCLTKPRRSSVNGSFETQARLMIADVGQAIESQNEKKSALVCLGDSRKESDLVSAVPRGADYIITSPPYPNEHDYTRCTRLELILLGHVQTLNDLRQLKQRMVRCNTKGIYVGDTDSRLVSRYRNVQKVATVLEEKAIGRTDGFSKLYGRMVREYFGGMVAHLRGAMKALRSGGRCAYVLKDQQALLGVHLDTPTILSALATSRGQGFKLQDVIEWKKARGTTGSRTLSERIIVLRKD